MSVRLHEPDRDVEVLVGAGATASRGRVVGVEGPAGIGKTSLLAAAGEAARARGIAVANARGSDVEVAYASGVVRQLFEPRLRGLLTFLDDS
jgi:ABC-type lipoprotein export system ATPase subunit